MRDTGCATRGARHGTRGMRHTRHTTRATQGIFFLKGEGPCAESKERAFEWFQKAANQGNAQAMVLMAKFYEDGTAYEDGQCVQSYQRAIELYNSAIAKGDRGALGKLALLYMEGKGITQSFLEAKRLLELALMPPTATER